MSEATLLSVEALNLSDKAQVHIGRWEMTGVAADSTSTELVEIEIPAINTEDLLHMPRKTYTSKALSFQLWSLAIDCDSENFSVRILDINDILAINTLDEIIVYTAINRSEMDADLGTLIISNRDAVQTNKIYLYFNNSDAVNDMGTVTLELIYSPLKITNS